MRTTGVGPLPITVSPTNSIPMASPSPTHTTSVPIQLNNCHQPSQSPTHMVSPSPPLSSPRLPMPPHTNQHPGGAPPPHMVTSYSIQQTQPQGSLLQSTLQQNHHPAMQASPTQIQTSGMPMPNQQPIRVRWENSKLNISSSFPFDSNSQGSDPSCIDLSKVLGFDHEPKASCPFLTQVSSPFPSRWVLMCGTALSLWGYRREPDPLDAVEQHRPSIRICLRAHSLRMSWLLLRDTEVTVPSLEVSQGKHLRWGLPHIQTTRSAWLRVRTSILECSFRRR